MLQRRQIVEAVADDHHRLALQPGAERRVALHQPGGGAIEREQSEEHHQDRQQRHVVVQHHIAGGRAEGEDHQDLEQGNLPHPASPRHLQEGEDHHVGERHPQQHFAKKQQRELVEKNALPVEWVHRSPFRSSFRSEQ
ncbi:hypothetical protein D9M73_255960 [compost metagenome]